MGTAIKTTKCTICGELTHMLGTKLCDNCWEIQHRLTYALGSEKVRAWLLRRMLTKDMADAIIDAENICWGEGLGPATEARQGGWRLLTDAAEEVADKSTYYSDWKRHQEKLLDKVDST